jgi:hypothetical protein
MKRTIKLTESEKNRILEMHKTATMKQYLNEQINDGKNLDQILISKFIEMGKAGKEYNTPGMMTQFFDDYSTEYQDWLVKNGFKMSDVNLSVGSKTEDIKRVNDLINQKGWK